jgi:hypothetical protein
MPTSIFNLHASFIGEHQENQPAENVVVAHELLKCKAEACSQLSLDPVDYWRVSYFCFTMYLFDF